MALAGVKNILSRAMRTPANGTRGGRAVKRARDSSKRAAARAKGKETSRKIEDLAEMIVESARKRKSPKMEIPIRALSNVSFNPKKAILEMGDAAQTRQFFDLSMAKKFMQTTLVAAQCKQLIDADKTASIRQMYYLCKHDVAGTKEKTFNDQDESDPIIEDIEVSIDALREELHVYASNKGNMVGPITLVDDGNTLD